MSTTVEEMIDRYISAWNGNDLPHFQTAFGKVWAINATYTDPNYENLTGIDAIANLALNSLELFPGRKFEVLTPPETHHNVGRYTWKVILSDGSSREGFDYFEFDESFKITRIVSFF